MVRLLVILSLVLSNGAGPAFGDSPARADVPCCCCGDAGACRCGCHADRPAPPTTEHSSTKSARLCDCGDLPLNLPARTTDAPQPGRDVAAASAIDSSVEVAGSCPRRPIDRLHGPPAPDLHEAGIILLI